MDKEDVMSTDSQERRSPRLLDQVRELIRIRHYSIRTERAYVQWIRRFILFHDKRHPLELGADEVTAFLSHLAVKRNVAASTQNQALNAIVFLYRDVFEVRAAVAGGRTASQEATAIAGGAYAR
jgi:hypothetical protein